MKYLYAHALSNAEGAANLLNSFQWVKELRQPALVVRFAAGVEFKGPPNLTDVKPIGSTQALPTRNQRGDTGGGGGPGFGAGAPGGPGFGNEGGFGGGGRDDGGVITQFAGDLGAGLVKEFETRVNRGDFGTVLKDAPKAGGRGAGSQGGGPGGYPGGPGMEGGPGLAGAPGGPAGFAGPGFEGGQGGQSASAASMRGMTILGVGDERELVVKAKEHGADVLALFEVSVKPNVKTGLVSNDTKIVLIDVAKGARLYTGRLLNNFKVQKARADSKDDGIEKEIASVFEHIDANLTMSPMPNGLTSEHITKRVASLIASKPDNLLPVLTEIRYWHRQNLLDDDGLTAAFSQLVSADVGPQLATGTEDERKEIVKRWLPADEG